MKLVLGVGLLLVVAEVFGATRKPSHKPSPTRKASTQPATQPTKPPTCPKHGKDFQVQIKVIGQGDYSYEMSQSFSSAFQDVREKIYDCALQTYADYDYYQDLILLSIENITGGFAPNFAIRFTKEGDGHLNRLSQAINSGKFCDLEVAPKFVKCDELDQALLYPPVATEPCQVTCTPPCANPCVNTAYAPVLTQAPAPLFKRQKMLKGIPNIMHRPSLMVPPGK